MTIECLVKAFFYRSFVVIWKESIMGRRDGKAWLGIAEVVGKGAASVETGAAQDSRLRQRAPSTHIPMAGEAGPLRKTFGDRTQEHKQARVEPSQSLKKVSVSSAT